METPALQPYPAELTIDYPDRELGRLTTLLRLILTLPVAIIAGMLSGFQMPAFDGSANDASLGTGLFLATVLTILVRQRYPRWWFDWQLALVRFSTRVEAYLCLMTDEYPALEEDQSVRLSLVYPDAKADLNRWLPLVKWFLLLPHYIVLMVLSVVALFCIILAWFAILFTRRYPRGLFDYNLSVFRYWLRIAAYGFLLITDRYPPFSLSD